MNPKAIINELRRINDWRRGDETVGQPAPGHFGDVLDAAAESLASLVASNTTLRRDGFLKATGLPYQDRTACSHVKAAFRVFGMSRILATMAKMGYGYGGAE